MDVIQVFFRFYLLQRYWWD